MNENGWEEIWFEGLFRTRSFSVFFGFLGAEFGDGGADGGFPFKGFALRRVVGREVGDGDVEFFEEGARFVEVVAVNVVGFAVSPMPLVGREGEGVAIAVCFEVVLDGLCIAGDTAGAEESFGVGGRRPGSGRRRTPGMGWPERLRKACGTRRLVMTILEGAAVGLRLEISSVGWLLGRR